MQEWEEVSAAETELFITEKVEISIIPNFSAGEVNLMVGNYEFVAHREVEVSLWLALMLKEKEKCRIIHPPWMELKFLEDLCDRQKK